MTAFRPLGITWAGLYAENHPLLVDFYTTKVGFAIVESWDGGCLLDAGAGALFEIWGKGAASPDRKTSHQQSMVVGFEVEDLDRVVEELAGRGVLPLGPIDGYLGQRWVYFADPEGNRFEFKDRSGP
jgi:predicted enzyme related to lactoylglutathione lyase